MILITVWGPLKFCAHGECLTLLTPVTAPCVTPGTTHTIAVASKPQSPGAAESGPVPRPVFCTCAVCPSGRARGRPGHPEGGAGLGRSSVHSGSLDEMKLPLTSSSLCPEINLPSESLSRWTESSFLFLGRVSGWAERGGLGALHRGFKQTRESRGRGQPRRACVHGLPQMLPADRMRAPLLFGRGAGDSRRDLGRRAAQAFLPPGAGHSWRFTERKAGKGVCSRLRFTAGPGSRDLHL